jgi:hypothetical protein
MCFTLWVIPLDLLGIFYWGISIKEAAIGFCVWYAIASLALTMNHRFFSHAAFKTSRPWRFVLAVVTLYGMQFGPIWWASKHRLHHKFCDQPADPHSWKQTSFFYAWWAWFHGHKEQVRAAAAPRASPRASRVTRPPARPPARSSCTEQAADPPPSCLSPPSAAPRGLMWRTCTRRSWRTSRSSTCPRASRRCIPSASAAPLDMCRAVSGGCGPSTARARRR